MSWPRCCCSEGLVRESMKEEGSVGSKESLVCGFVGIILR